MSLLLLLLLIFTDQIEPFLLQFVFGNSTIDFNSTDNPKFIAHVEKTLCESDYWCSYLVENFSKYKYLSPWCEMSPIKIADIYCPKRNYLRKVGKRIGGNNNYYYYCCYYNK